MSNIFQQLKTLQKAELAAYSPGLNVIKGLLVLLVIFGHAINIKSNLQFIYFFHMPLFLAISGFLVKKSAFKDGIGNYLKRIINRAIIPWIIAFFVFLPILFYDRNISTFNLKDVIYPYYHLWYIPAYLFATIFCFFTIKFNIPSLLVLIITASVTSFWFLTYRNSSLEPEQLPVFFLGDKRIYGYLLFFYLGFAIRNKILNLRPNAILLAILIGITSLAILVFIFKHLPEYSLLIPYLICNVCLIFFIVIYTSSQNWTNNKFILFLNTQSLGVYLYHPLFIFMAYQYLENPQRDKSNTLEAIIIFVITTLLSAVLVWLFTQFEFTNKYVLGNIKK